MTSCSSCGGSPRSQPNTNSSSEPPTSQAIKSHSLTLYLSLFRDSDNWHQPPNLFRPQSHRFQPPSSTEPAIGTSSLRFPRCHPQQRRLSYALIVPEWMELLQNFPLHLQPPVPSLDVLTLSNIITFAHSVLKIISSTIQVYIRGINISVKLSSGPHVQPRPTHT